MNDGEFSFKFGLGPLVCSDSEFYFWNSWLYCGHSVGLLGRGISPTQGLYLHSTKIVRALDRAAIGTIKT